MLLPYRFQNYEKQKDDLVTEIDDIDDYNDGYDEAYAEFQQILEEDKQRQNDY